MSLHPVIATLVVAVTLLLCALLPQVLRDATVLLQYRSAQLPEGILRMNSSRQMAQSKPYAYAKQDGECPKKHRVTKDKCLRYALRLGFTEPGLTIPALEKGGYFVEQDHKTALWPAGCYVRQDAGKTKVFYNVHDKTRSCDSHSTCICFGNENDPQESPLDPPEGAYTEGCGNCPSKGQIGNLSHCRDTANVLGLHFTSEKEVDSENFPAGCSLEKFNHTLVFNTKTDGGATCDLEGVSCVCSAGKPTPYTVQTETCPTNERLGKCDCKRQAEELGVTFSFYDSETMHDRKYPAGCVLINKQLWYNSERTSTATCDKSEAGQWPEKNRQCICARAG